MFNFGGNNNLGSLLAKIGGSVGDDKPENWSEERLDMEIQSEMERLMLSRWSGRFGGFGSSLAIGKYLVK